MIGERFKEVITAENGVELREHGTRTLPIGAYDNDYSDREAVWHWHREFEIIHMIKGSLRVSVPNEQITLKSGDIMFINSGVMHAAANAGTGECLFHGIVFLPDFLCSGAEGVLWQKYIYPLMEKTGLQSITFSENSKDIEHVRKSAEEFWKACVEEPFGYEFMLREQLSRIVCTIIANCKGDENVVSSKRQRAGERVKDMLEYIQENYMDEITTSTLAACASISESECLRCFRNVLGTTPIQYVKKYRLQLAADMLRTTEYSVTEIAGRCGFAHMSYFAKAFQEMFGVTPREYRREAPLKRKG